MNSVSQKTQTDINAIIEQKLSQNLMSLLQHNKEIDLLSQSKHSLCDIIVSLNDAIDKKHKEYPSQKELYDLIYKTLGVDEFEKEKQKIIKITQLSIQPIAIPKILQIDHDEILSDSNEFKNQNEEYIIGEDENELKSNTNINNNNKEDEDDFNNDNGTEFDNDAI